MLSMITNDGFRKKKCYLEGDNILIDGESYPITNIKQTENYKSRMIFLIVIMLLMTAFVAYAGYMGLQDNIINNSDSSDRIVNVFFLLVAFGLFACLWRAVVNGYKYSNCRSLWIINGKGIYVEQNDDIEIEQIFREIGLRLRNTGNEEAEIDSFAKSNKKEAWLWLIMAGFFFGVLALGLSNYLSENIFIPLLLFAIALVFILRLYSLKKDYDNLKWKK